MVGWLIAIAVTIGIFLLCFFGAYLMDPADGFIPEHTITGTCIRKIKDAPAKIRKEREDAEDEKASLNKYEWHKRQNKRIEDLTKEIEKREKELIKKRMLLDDLKRRYY